MSGQHVFELPTVATCPLRGELESQSQRRLHTTRRPRAYHMAKPCVGLDSGSIEAHCRANSRKPRVIERIVHLPAELQGAGLTFQRDILEESKVPVVGARQPEH